MTATGWAWLAAAGILAVVDWIAVARGVRLAERIAKPLVLLAIVLAAVAAQPIKPGVHGWLIAALCLGLAGDVALVAERRPARSRVGAHSVTIRAEAASKAPRLSARGSSDGPQWFFLAGLLAFLVGHLCYARAMQLYGTDKLSVAFGLVLVLIALLSFGYRIIAGAHALGGSRLIVAVVLYVVALGSAVVLGVGTEQLWIAGGIVLFAASDLVLAHDRFVQARPLAPLTVAISYHLAQALLLLGLVS
jgi:uncharacterized membrane protein YhhN